MTEKPLRSIAKAISWRVTGTLLTLVATFLITWRLDFAFSLSIVDVVIKVAVFYLHERLWSRIKFGACSEDLKITARAGNRRRFRITSRPLKLARKETNYDGH